MAREFPANWFLTSDQVRGHATPENAPSLDDLI